jgi:ABC-2 type transport system permease protein
LQLVSDVFPLTYAYDALARVTEGSPLGGRFALDVGVVVGVMLLALALGAATLRRRTE